MSLDEKRNAVGKVLACLLLCSKGGCTIKKLENDYRNEEGHSIPYQEFGYVSAIDFFRAIPSHVRVVNEGGQYLVYPMVTEKTQHIKNLVARQKTPRMSSRRKSSRPSRYYPSTSTPRPFVPFKVQKSVAQLLTTNPSGVSRSCVAEQLQQSRAIAGTVDADNVDEFVTGMPHTAVSSGNKIYPSRSLGARPRSTQRGFEDFDGFDIVSPRQITSEEYAAALPAGSEDADEVCEPETCGEGSRYLSYDVRAKKNAARRDERAGRMSSAAFIDKAAGLQYAEVNRECSNRERTDSAREVERHVEEEEETFGPDCVYVSDDEKSVEIIGSRMKERLVNLMKKYPDGVWCADLVEAYSTEYKVGFNYKDYGFSSVSEFASQLKDIFHVVRLNARGDFKLYDASQPAPQSESRPVPRPMYSEWQEWSEDDYADPLPLSVEDKASLGLVPSDVMAYGESVGQIKIPNFPNQVPEGPDYSTIEVFVSEVYTPSFFWIHLRRERARLERFMTSLHDFYQREGDNYTIPTVVLEKGLNCVCTFQDKWHRAVIKSVKPSGDVTLTFYDYGTTQTYPPESVRFLTWTYSNLPAQAIPCGLYNIRPINSDLWTRGASMKFYEKVEELPLIAMLIKVDEENNSALVSLVDTRGEVDFHINDWMVREGLAEIGSLVRSRPSNFVIRHYAACLKYQNDRKLMNERQIGTTNKRAGTISENVTRSETATSSGSEIKLKSADRLKEFMAKYSKYRKKGDDSVSKCVEQKSTNSSSEISARVDKGCSSNGINALRADSQSHSIDERDTSKKSFVFLNPNRQKTGKDQHRNNSSSLLTRSKQLSENNNLPEASGAKPSETPALPYSGTFRSFFGGQEDLPHIDWSMMRNDMEIPEESVDREEKTVESLPQKEPEKSSHYKMVSNNRKVNVKYVNKSIERTILPAEDCFVDAVRSNRDHYYSAHGEWLRWSREGNTSKNPGLITSLLKERRKSLTENDIDLTKVSGVPEKPKTRIDSLQNEATNGVSDPGLDFLHHLKKAVSCAAGTSRQISTLQNKTSLESSTPLKSSALSNVPKASQSIGSTTSRSSLASSRIAKAVDYMKKKQKLNATSESVSDKLLASATTLGSSIFSDCSTISERIDNIQIESQSHSVKEPEKDYITSQIQAPSRKRSLDRNSSSASSLSSENVRTVHKSDNRCKREDRVEVPRPINSSEKLDPIVSQKKNEIFTPTNVDNVSDSIDYERVDGMIETDPKSSETVTKICSTPCKNADTTTDLDSDDLSHSASSSESEIIRIALEKRNLKSNEKTLKDSALKDDNKVQEPLASNNVAVKPDDNEQRVQEFIEYAETEKLEDERSSAASKESLSNDSEDLLGDVTPNHVDICLPERKSSSFIPVVNDIDSMSDSDEWDVNGGWKEFMKEKSDFMTQVVEKLKITSDSNPVDKNLESYENSRTESMENSEYSSTETPPRLTISDYIDETDLSTRSIQTLNNNRTSTITKSQKSATYNIPACVNEQASSDELNNPVEGVAESSANPRNQTSIEKPFSTEMKRSKTKSMREMLENFKSKKLISNRYKDSPVDNNNRPPASVSDVHSNVESALNTSTEEDTSTRESLADSEMFGDASNNLSSSSSRCSGDSVDLEFCYYEDQPQLPVQNVVTTQAANVPLITPQSTLPDSGTLRPPPGFTNPSEPTNYAAMMDENLRSRNYSYTTTENSVLFNHCKFSMNNNSLATATALCTLLTSLTPEALGQVWKMVAVASQFLPTDSTTTTPMNSNLNTTNVETPSLTVQKKTNPFESYQDRELALPNFLPNLSTNTSEFDNSNYLNSTTSPQPSEREMNVTSGDSYLLDLDERILREAADGDIDELSVRLHDTNPFRQHLIRGDSSPVETNNNTLKGPPIPPRNPSSINKNVNLATTKIPDVNPSPRIYYTAKPVMYKLNDTDENRDEETLKFGKPVSSGGNQHYKIINSSHEITNHSLSLEIREQAPSTPVRKMSTNDTQFLSPRISPSNYRPPPPPYNGNCTVSQYSNKRTISPRYPSPLASGDSRALIEDIQLPTLNFFDKLESVAAENPGLESRNEKSRKLGSFEKHTSSFATTKIATSLTTPESSTFHTKNATEPKKKYKIKVIIPKSLQDQESLNNQTKALSETLGITPRLCETQDFIKQEQSSSAKKQNDQTHNLHSDGSRDSEEPRGHSNPFVQTEAENREKSWKRSTVEQRPWARTERDNSGMTYNGERTRDFDHLGFSTSTKPMHESPIISAQPYQSRPHYYQPMYPHHFIHQQIHPMPAPMQFSQQMHLHRPNMPAYLPPPPPWVRQQLYNAAYSHAAAHPSQPPLNPNFRNQNLMFSTPQTAGVPQRAGANEGRQNSTMGVSHSDSSLQLNGSSFHLANGCVAQSGIEERDKEVGSFIVAAEEEKDPQVEESTTSSLEESIIEILNGSTENVPVVEPVKIFKPIEVKKQMMYIFNIDNQGWVCTDEIVQVFLPSETRNIVLRLLKMSNVHIDFLEISRDQSPDLFAQLDDSAIRLPRMTNSRRIRGVLHLTPIQLLYRMMMALRVISDKDIESSKKQKPLPGTNLAELVKLVLAYRSDDAYWA